MSFIRENLKAYPKVNQVYQRHIPAGTQPPEPSARTMPRIPAGARQHDSQMFQKQLSEYTPSLYLMLNLFM